VGPASGSDPTAELSDFFSVGVASNLDDGCELNLVARGDTETTRIISELDTDAWVYLDGSLFQRFRLTNIQQEWGPSGEDRITAIGGCYRRILYRRLLNNALSYSGVGQGTIAWGLIADTQAADSGGLGITQGTLIDTTTRDRTYLAGENVGELLENLARVIGGPRYVLGGDLVFNALAGDSFPTQSVPLLLGVTARSMVRQSGADLYANVVRGSGDVDVTTPVVEETTDVAAGTEARGRWESAQTWGTVTEQSTVQEKTEGELQERTAPVASWTADIEPERWLTDFVLRAGDICEIVVPRSTVAPVGVPTTQVTGQCVDLTFSIDASGVLTVGGAFVETPTG
jgi:hypothetical protein